MDILEKIIAVKKEEVKLRKAALPVKILEKSPFYSRTLPSFIESLAGSGPSIIGEFKRRSPSKGDINPSADIFKVAKGYQDAGISAMSVLTDERFFGGSNYDLESLAGRFTMPLLRKEFIIDEYQVIESKSIGASAILLIASVLEEKEAETLTGLAVSLGLEVLFELHGEKDIEKMNENIRIAGINNRNLRNFGVDMERSVNMIRLLPDKCIKVAESGFKTPEEVKLMFSVGYKAFLIGERFMRSDDPGVSAKEFISELR